MSYMAGCLLLAASSTAWGQEQNGGVASSMAWGQEQNGGVASSTAWGQEQRAGFTADRPGATNGPDVLPLGRLQWETGVGYEYHKPKGEGSHRQWTLNTSMIRFGIFPAAELRVQADYSRISAGGSNHAGLSHLSVGTKVRLHEGHLLMPAMSLLAVVFVPGSAQLLPEHWGGLIGLVGAHEPTERWSIGYDAELTWMDDDRPVLFCGISLGYALSQRLSASLEEYNDFAPDGNGHWAELSAALQLSKRLQLDMGLDVSLREPLRYACLTFGLSWQLNQ